jgi:hypothetical protein
MPLNDYARAARDKKVRALVIYFDIEFARREVDPIDSLREPAKMIDALRALTQEEWKLHAVLAGQRPPSFDSQNEVVAQYVKRVFELEAGNVEHLDHRKRVN